MVGIAVDGRALGGVIYKARGIAEILFSSLSALWNCLMLVSLALPGYKQLDIRAPRVWQGSWTSSSHSGKSFQLIWAWKGQRSPRLTHLHIMDEVYNTLAINILALFSCSGWDESSLPWRWRTQVGCCVKSWKNGQVGACHTLHLRETTSQQRSTAHPDSHTKQTQGTCSDINQWEY